MDYRERKELVYLIAALVIALVAMAVTVRSRTAWRRCSMPLGGDRDHPALDEALRHVSARMVAGDALFMAVASLAAVVAWLMTDELS